LAKLKEKLDKPGLESDEENKNEIPMQEHADINVQIDEDDQIEDLDEKEG